jgi:hypothetical protein
VLGTSKLRRKQSIGRRRTVTIPLSLASGTSTTNRILITGARLKVGLPAGFDSLFLTTSVNETSVRARLLVVPSKRLNKFLPRAVGPGPDTRFAWRGGDPRSVAKCAKFPALRNNRKGQSTRTSRDDREPKRKSGAPVKSLKIKKPGLI